MCKNIGVSQSTLSRMEMGELIPSAHHWVEFCRITAISPNSYVCGFIDSLRLNSPITLRSGSREGHFTLPAEYSSSRGSMVRSLRVPMNYLENRLTEQAAHDWLDSRGVDPDFFVDLNNQLNLQFSYDLLDFMNERGLVTAATLDEMTRQAGDSTTHGNLKPVFDMAPSHADRLKQFVSHSKNYDADFAYRVEDERLGFIDISISPESHVSEFKRPEGIGDALCQFRRKFIENFSTYAGGPGVRVLEPQCQYHGASSCLYRVPIQ